MLKKRYFLLIAMVAVALMLGACSGGSGSSGDTDTTASVDNTKAVLTVSGYQGTDQTYTQADLEKLGTKTVKFSGRNKENNNERQVRDYTGVELKTLLEAAGYGKAGETMKVTCSDGYTREYEVDSLYDLYFFDGEKAKKGEKVQPLLAIIREGDSIGNDKTYQAKDGSPLRLVYGQADYDSEYTKDFNMQGWASYVEKIEVSKANE